MEQNNVELKIPEEFQEPLLYEEINRIYSSYMALGEGVDNTCEFAITGLRLYLYPKKVQDFIHFTSISIDDKEDDKIVHYVLKNYEGHIAHKTYRFSQITDEKIKLSFCILRNYAYGGYLNTLTREDAWDDKKDTISNNLKVLGVYIIFCAEVLYRKLNNLEQLTHTIEINANAIKNIIALYNFQVNEEDEEE